MMIDEGLDTGDILLPTKNSYRTDRDDDELHSSAAIAQSDVRNASASGTGPRIRKKQTKLKPPTLLFLNARRDKRLVVDRQTYIATRVRILPTVVRQ